MRTYERTHEWISFEIDMRKADPRIWLALGEIQSKCEHLAGVPLRPDVAERLHELFLAKGVRATTAIEGNTLSEDEVERRIQGNLPLPPSKEYLGKEIDNIVSATDSILADIVGNDPGPLTPEDLNEYNSLVLAGLEVEEGVIPGEVRRTSVGVAGYRGAPAEDCPYLLKRLCDWLSSEIFEAPEGYEIVYGVLRAVVAHLYIAWIHPFGDGNGRTARLAEVRLLLEAGAPSAAAHLLSNYYNETRSEYYRQLDYASKSGGDLMRFIRYAAEGLCEELRDQIEIVKSQQIQVTWTNYVHDQFRDKRSVTDHRRRHLVLEISKHYPDTVPVSKLRGLSPRLAELYAGKTMKTINRDINVITAMRLVDRGYIRGAGRTLRARVETISAFMPQRRTRLDDGQEAA